MNHAPLLRVALGLLAATTLAFAAAPVSERPPPAPLMSIAGSAVAEDSFTTALPKTWRAGKGTWELADGAVRGTEVPADKHQAVLRRPVAFTNAVISFSFRLDQARQISVSINDAKEHVCRVVINARGFVVQKDDHDHAGPDKAVVFARIPMTIAPGEWHTAVVEIVGSEMVAQIDDATHVGFGAHELLNRPKANVGFTVAGGPAEFRDFSLRNAELRSDWAETRSRLAAAKRTPVAAAR